MRHRLQGLGAVVGIVLLVVGVPAGLILAGGSPLESGVPSLGELVDALTQPDDGGLLLVVLAVAGWVAWLTFTAMLLLEIGARLRGVRPPRLPALAVPQKAAAGLVGAAALLFVASPAVSSAAMAADAAPVASTSAVSSTATAGDIGQETQPDQVDDHEAGGHASEASGPRQDVSASSTSSAAVAPAVQTVSYTTRPGDSLWAVAERLLGDGSRWQEIADLNYDVLQPDGQALDQSHWVGTGWTLQVPAPTDAAGAAGAAPAGSGEVAVKPGDTLSQIALEELGDGDRYPELYDASTTTEQPGGEQLHDPDHIEPGWTIIVPQAPVTGADPDGAGSTPQDDAQEDEARPGTDPDPQDQGGAGDKAQAPSGGDQRGQAPGGQGEGDQNGEQQGGTANTGADGAIGAADAAAELDAAEVPPVRTVAGVGSLLAVGVIGLIAVRRGAQRRKRKPGQAVPMPDGEAAEVEQELRATEDPMSVVTVDLALRTLASRCAAAGEPLPVVRAGRLTGDQFDLYLAEPAQLPAPWEGTTDPQVWVLSADAQGLISEQEAADVPSPYPSLVTVGHDLEDGHVMLDLEHLGALGVTGDAEQTRQVLAAIAVELATSRWADDLQVTVVGAYPQLEDSLATGRVRYLPVAGRLVEELSSRAEQDREALAVTGAGDLFHARTSGAAPGAWTPEIVLLAGDVTDAQRDQLQRLVQGLPRVAIAAVTGGTLGDWAVRLTGPQTAVLDPLGLELRPQLLDDHTYAQLLNVLALAEEDQVDAQERTEQAGVVGTGVAGQSAGWAAEPEPTLADLPAPANKDAAGPAAEETVETPQADVDEPAVDEPAVDEPAVDEPAVDEPAVDEVGVYPATTDGPSTGAAADAAETVDQGAAPVDAVHTQEPVATDGAAVDQVEATETDAEPASGGEVRVLPKRGPVIRLLGPVELAGADGPVESSKVARLTELASYLALHPGADHVAIDAAHWPGREVSNNTRNTVMSQLRRWLGKTADGDDFLPRFEASVGYRLHEDVTTDWQQWRELVPGEACDAPTDALEAAMALVDGLPFSGVRARRYAWAETLRQEMITAIVDASYVLARRRLLAGRWVEAETVALAGLMIEPGVEGLWRARLLALHGRGNATQLDKAVADLLNLAEDWGGELEDTTETLLEQLASNAVPPRGQLADAL